MANKKISIKVVADKVKKRVVYAEANYTFVDILFSFMTMPLGTIVRLLEDLDEDIEEDDSKFEAFESLNNLYESLEDFPTCYLAKKRLKSRLLNPTSLFYDHCIKLKLELDEELLNICSNCSMFRGSRSYLNTSCPRCEKSIEDIDIHSDSSESEDDEFQNGLFVSKIATFIVTDDLCVMPYTSGTTIQLLMHNGITDTSSLEDFKFYIDSEKMLFLLKMAISMDSPLSYLVFYGINPFKYASVCGISSIITGETDLITKEELISEFDLEVHLQKSTGKVLFAEAKEDFIDFLFGLLSIPLGTVVGELLKGESSLTCMNNLFKSICKCADESFRSSDMKYALLIPHIGQFFPSKNRLFPLQGLPLYDGNKKLKNPRSKGGLLKRCANRFMVTDDLVVTPSSSSSTMNTLNKLNVSFDDIQKYEVTVGIKEGLKILKASLLSCSTLTHSLKHQLKK